MNHDLLASFRVYVVALVARRIHDSAREVEVDLESEAKGKLENNDTSFLKAKGYDAIAEEVPNIESAFRLHTDGVEN